MARPPHRRAARRPAALSLAARALLARSVGTVRRTALRRRRASPTARRHRLGDRPADLAGRDQHGARAVPRRSSHPRPGRPAGRRLSRGARSRRPMRSAIRPRCWKTSRSTRRSCRARATAPPSRSRPWPSPISTGAATIEIYSRIAGDAWTRNAQRPHRPRHRPARRRPRRCRRPRDRSTAASTSARCAGWASSTARAFARSRRSGGPATGSRPACGCPSRSGRVPAPTASIPRPSTAACNSCWALTADDQPGAYLPVAVRRLAFHRRPDRVPRSGPGRAAAAGRAISAATSAGRCRAPPRALARRGLVPLQPGRRRGRAVAPGLALRPRLGAAAARPAIRRASGALAAAGRPRRDRGRARRAPGHLHPGASGTCLPAPRRGQLRARPAAPGAVRPAPGGSGPVCAAWSISGASIRSRTWTTRRLPARSACCISPRRWRGRMPAKPAAVAGDPRRAGGRRRRAAGSGARADLGHGRRDRQRASRAALQLRRPRRATAQRWPPSFSRTAPEDRVGYRERPAPCRPPRPPAASGGGDAHRAGADRGTVPGDDEPPRRARQPPGPPRGSAPARTRRGRDRGARRRPQLHERHVGARQLSRAIPKASARSASNAPARSPPSGPDVDGLAARRRGRGLRASTAWRATRSPMPGSWRASPRGLGFAQAATVPIAFLTAHYALEHLGRLMAGERVLIHSAAGGVGLAAIADRRARRRRDLRHRRQRGEARSCCARSASRTCSTRARSPSPTRSCALTGGRRRRRRPELAGRRGDRRKPVELLRAVRPVPGDRQARHLRRTRASACAPFRRPARLLRDRPRGRARGPARPCSATCCAASWRIVEAGALAPLPDEIFPPRATRRRLPPHGAGPPHRQDRRRRSSRRSPPRARPPLRRRRGLPDHRRPRRPRPRGRALAGRARRPAPRAGRPPRHPGRPRAPRCAELRERRRPRAWSRPPT